jgi:prophage antirepressor-like protein
MKLLEFNQPSESFRVRRVDHNNEDWFIARDICDSLGIEQTSPALAKLDPDEVNQIHLIDALKSTQQKAQ